MKQIKIAITGTGRVAAHYKKILSSGLVKNFSLISVCDIDITAAKLFAEDWGDIKIFDNLSDLIEVTKPDLIIICTPSGFHYEHAKEALNAGCHVLVEKPATMLPSEAEELVNLAKNNSLVYSVAFQNRFNPAILKLKSAIDNGRLGKIVTVNIRLRWCRYQNYYDDYWHGTWLIDGGVINQHAIHHIDILNWLFGPIQAVVSSITNRLNILEAEDTHVAIVEFEDGHIGTIEATTAARPHDYEASISVVGEQGMVVVDGIALNKISTWSFINSDSSDKDTPQDHSEEVSTGYGISHYRLLQSIIDGLQGSGESAGVPVSETISTTCLIHALYASYEQKRWVRLDERVLSSKLGLKHA